MHSSGTSYSLERAKRTAGISMVGPSVGLSLFMGEHVMAHGPILAGAVLSIVPILAFFLAAQKTFTQGIAMSGMKG
jgi:ABC-type glycerol-3-phosphate transport system permease component